MDIYAEQPIYVHLVSSSEGYTAVYYTIPILLELC